MFFTTLCLTNEEKEKIKKLFHEDKSLEINEQRANIISKTLEHPYFDDRFSNFKKILGAGTEGIVFEVDFRLLENHSQTIPAALKINFGNVDEMKEKLIENYLNLMVNPDDQSRNDFEDGYVIFNLSNHFQKLFNKDPSAKNDMPFICMIYEAATIPLIEMKNDSKIVKYVSVSLTQLGFSGLFGNFLPSRDESENPDEYDEILDKNSKKMAEMIIQISYAIWRIHEEGYIHEGIHVDNIVIAGNLENFNPLIIDFDRLVKQSDLLSKSYPLQDGMLNESNSNYPEYLKHVGDPNYFIGSDENAFYFEHQSFEPSSFLTPEWQERFSKFPKVYLINTNFKYDIEQLVYLLEIILDVYIGRDLVDQFYQNIQGLRKQIKSMAKKINNGEGISLSSSELFKILNDASGLNLTEFKSDNQDLESYFEKIRSESAIEDTTKTPKKEIVLNADNEERIILV
jgi:hypothetical protein